MDMANTKPRTLAGVDGRLGHVQTLRAASEEIVELARALVRGATLQTHDPVLQVAVTRVKHSLDDYDDHLIAKAVSESDDSPSRQALESALARRIADEQLAVSTEWLEAAGQDDAPASSGD